MLFRSEETTREVAAAQYEMETAQAQQRAHEDAILTLEERCSHYGVLLADLRRQRDDQKTELEQLQKRAAQTEQDTGNARRRIEALEGAAAALRAEAEGKAQGQSRFQEKAGEIGAEIAEFNMRLASLDAERMASEKALDELEGLRRDMAGDRELN